MRIKIIKHLVSSSDNGGLYFVDSDEYEKFCEEIRAVYVKYHNLEVEKYGIYASNQDRFVKSVDELNQLDNYPHPLDR